MMKLLSWFDENLELLVGVPLFIVMTILLACQVSSRYILNFSVSWTEELAMYCLIWMCYLGASLAVKQRRHLRIQMLFEWSSPKTKKVVDIISNLVCIAFCSYLTLGTYEMLELILRGTQVSAGSGLPKWVPNMGLPFAFGLMSIRFVQDTVRLVREYRELN